MKEPPKDLGTSLSQWIVQALFHSRAETIQRDTKTRNSNLRHLYVLLASKSCYRLFGGDPYEPRIMNSRRVGFMRKIDVTSPLQYELVLLFQ
jgi:hypothetical protein